MNQLEDDGERMVELGHPAVGPIQVPRPPEPCSLGRGLPREAGERERETWPRLGTEGRAREWVHGPGFEGSMLPSPGPPGGPQDGVAELPEPVHLPGEPPAAR